MKSFSEYIKEAYNFRLGGKDKKGFYHYNFKPKDDNKELKELVDKLIKERGDEADLNDIDTSEITYMFELFKGTKFNGDISLWDTSNVIDMNSMFYEAANFNCDISGWDTSSVVDMRWMFYYALEFNQDLSKWNVDNVTSNGHMFHNCPLKQKFMPKFKK